MRSLVPAGRRFEGALAWLAVAALGWASPCQAAETAARPEGELARPVITRWSRPRPVDLESASRHRSAAAAEASESSFLSLEDEPEGDMPLDLAFTSASEVAIVNRDSSNVTFLDTAAGTITRSVSVGQFPVDLAVTPDGRYALTADLGDDTVSVLDLATHKVKATVPVTGQQPFQIEVTADSRFAVVGLINNATASAFSVIDLGTLREVRTIPSAPQGVTGGWFSPFSGATADVFTRFALTPDGRRIVLAETYESRVVVYDRQTGAQLASIPTKKAPADIDISSDGTFAIVSHEVFPEPGEVTRIDLQGLRVDRLYATPFPPHTQHVRITPDRRTVLVTGYSDDEGGLTAFIDLQTGAVTSTVSSGIAEQIVLTADGKSAFLASTIPGYVLDLATQTLASYLPPPEAALYRAAASPTGRRVAAIDSQFGESVYLYDLSGPEATLLATALTGEIAESDAPVSLALTPDGATAVVGHRVSGNMAVVDLAAGSVSGYADTGRDTRDVATAVTPGGTWALATSYEDDTLTVVDLATRQRLASLPMPDGPDRILVSPDGRTAYVFTLRGQDQVYFVALNGAQSHIVSALPAVNRFGIGFGTSSTGVALSGDGRLLAVCGGSPNVLQLIDTSTRQEIARVPLGALPRRVVLSHDHTKAWVSDLENGVTVIRIGSGSASVQAVIPVASPFDLHLDSAEAFVYAVSGSTSQHSVYVIDAASDVLVATVSIATAANSSLGASDLATGPNLLYIAGLDTRNPPRAVVTRLEAAGANTRIRDFVLVSEYPAELEVTGNGQRAVLTQTSLDGLDLALFDAAAGVCIPAPARLCLNQSRFQVDVTWRTPQGLTGTGQARPLTDDAGAFWFFAEANLEMMVKVLNGCASNNRYWVFAAGLTNVEVTLKVTDRKTGTVRTYTNPLGTAFKPLQDTAAFAPCP